MRRTLPRTSCLMPGLVLCVEMAIQHAAKRVLEQVEPAIGGHKFFDLRAKLHMLAGRHLPQCRHR